MAAGRLRHRVTLTQPAEVNDGAGGVTTTWSSLATVWAGVEPLSGREYLEAAEAAAAVSIRVVLRYRSDITAKMRAVWGSHTYEINSVTFDPRRTYTELMCVEVS